MHLDLLGNDLRALRRRLPWALPKGKFLLLSRNPLAQVCELFFRR